MEPHKGFSTCFKQLVPWLDTAHCFNHMIELAFKDIFHKIPVFQKIDNFLLQFYYMYENIPKWSRGLQEFSFAYQSSIPKPTKANGTRWLERTYSAIKTVLKNFGFTRFKELAQTDSNWGKRAQIKDWQKFWKGEING